MISSARKRTKETFFATSHRYRSIPTTYAVVIRSMRRFHNNQSIAFVFEKLETFFAERLRLWSSVQQFQRREGNLGDAQVDVMQHEVIGTAVRHSSKRTSRPSSNEPIPPSVRHRLKIFYVSPAVGGSVSSFGMRNGKCWPSADHEHVVRSLQAGDRGTSTGYRRNTGFAAHLLASWRHTHVLYVIGRS